MSRVRRDTSRDIICEIPLKEKDGRSLQFAQMVAHDALQYAAALLFWWKFILFLTAWVAFIDDTSVLYV